MSKKVDIDALDDEQIVNCLNRLIASAKEEFPADQFGEPDFMCTVLEKVGAEIKLGDFKPRADTELSNMLAVSRRLLHEMQQDPALDERIRNALSNMRPVREPISTVLVMTGVVFLLSTRFEMKISRKSGLTDFSINLKKDPTSLTVIKKLLGLLG